MMKGALIGAALAVMILPSSATAAEEVVARIRPYGGDSLFDYPVLTIIRRDGQTIARLSAENEMTDLPGEAAWRRLQTFEGWDAPPPPPAVPFSGGVIALPPLCHVQSVHIELALPGQSAQRRDVRATCRPNPPWDFAADLYRTAIKSDPACAGLLDHGNPFDLAERCLRLQGVREAALEVSALLATHRDRRRTFRGLSPTSVEVTSNVGGQPMKRVWVKGADGRWRQSADP